jgi:hypothetical protein
LDTSSIADLKQEGVFGTLGAVMINQRSHTSADAIQDTAPQTVANADSRSNGNRCRARWDFGKTGAVEKIGDFRVSIRVSHIKRGSKVCLKPVVKYRRNAKLLFWLPDGNRVSNLAVGAALR